MPLLEGSFLSWLLAKISMNVVGLATLLLTLSSSDQVAHSQRSQLALHGHDVPHELIVQASARTCVRTELSCETLQQVTSLVSSKIPCAAVGLQFEWSR